MDQSHHHAETNKSVLNKYLTLDQGNRYVSLISVDNLNRMMQTFFEEVCFDLQGASSLHLDWRIWRRTEIQNQNPWVGKFTCLEDVGVGSVTRTLTFRCQSQSRTSQSGTMTAAPAIRYLFFWCFSVSTTISHQQLSHPPRCFGICLTFPSLARPRAAIPTPICTLWRCTGTHSGAATISW